VPSSFSIDAGYKGMGRNATSREFSSRQQFHDIWNESGVGVAIFDEQLRYQALNSRLADINGVPLELHVGKHLREILGEVAFQVEPALKQVFDTGQPILSFETAGTLPSKPESKRWISNFFPVRDANGRVKQVGAIVVELGQAVQPQSPEPVNKPPRKAITNANVLRSWKEIANYMGACVKTVQRWEHSYGLPVRRLAVSKGSAVFALTSEIDGWMVARTRFRNR